MDSVKNALNVALQINGTFGSKKAEKKEKGLFNAKKIRTKILDAAEDTIVEIVSIGLDTAINQF